MDAEVQALLRELLLTQRVASLGTLRRGRDFDEPSLSMVPFAWLPGTADVVLHVSALAQHTRLMVEHPRTSLMIVAPLRDGDNPLALPRATLQCDAARLEPGTPEHSAAAAAYLGRFPQAEQTFALADFSLFRLTPRGLHFVAGFARTSALRPDALAQLLAGEVSAARD